MNLQLLFGLVFPAAFLFGVGDILYIQAKKLGRSVLGWVTFGCVATILGGVFGALAAPVVVGMVGQVGPKAERLFFVTIFLPAVLVALSVGGWLALLGPVAKRSKSSLGAAITLKADEWHTRDSCKACGFLFETGDAMCQCPACAGYFHVKCWNENDGCTACSPSEHGAARTG